jgi:16S rRNA processing protein RimM
MSANLTSGSESSEPRFLALGQILRPHGIRGELRMRILTDYPERIAQLAQVFVADDVEAGDPVAYQVTHMRMHQNYGLLQLAGVEDRNQAELFRDLYVLVAIEDAVPLEEGEFYLYQLIGIAVQTETGEILGHIQDVLETGANDVYIVDSPEHGEILIPATAETIIHTDIQQQVMTVKLPDGLLNSGA